MSRRHYKLPSLTSLATFETVARNNSFKKAAIELGVTSGAVSHQVKFLETELGVLLFNRQSNEDKLTYDGETLFKSLKNSFSTLALTLANLRRNHNGRQDVTISSTTAISSLWLTPLLSKFWKKHPDIPVNQHITDSPDVQGVAIDLKINYGFVESQSKQKRVLFYDELVPICSPDFANKKPNPSIDELAKFPLIHLKTKNKNWSSWFYWFNALGCQTEISQGIHVNNYMIALQEASDGIGVVLGWRHLVSSKLLSGELVVLGNTSIPAPSAIYIMSEREDLLKTNVKLLRDFIITKQKL